MTRLAKAGRHLPRANGCEPSRSEKTSVSWLTPATGVNVLLALLAVAAVYISLVSAPGMIGVLAAGLALTMLAIAVIDCTQFYYSRLVECDRRRACDGLCGRAGTRGHGACGRNGDVARSGAGLVFFGVRAGYARLRGRQGLGMGDVKLAFVAGAWLDWIMIPLAIQFAAFAALSVYLLRQLVYRQPISPTQPDSLWFVLRTRHLAMLGA